MDSCSETLSGSYVFSIFLFFFFLLTAQLSFHSWNNFFCFLTFHNASSHYSFLFLHITPQILACSFSPSASWPLSLCPNEPNFSIPTQCCLPWFAPLPWCLFISGSHWTFDSLQIFSHMLASACLLCHWLPSFPSQFIIAIPAGLG